MLTEEGSCYQNKKYLQTPTARSKGWDGTRDIILVTTAVDWIFINLRTPLFDAIQEESSSSTKSHRITVSKVFHITCWSKASCRLHHWLSSPTPTIHPPHQTHSPSSSALFLSRTSKIHHKSKIPDETIADALNNRRLCD